jgi:hypothetical protein
MSADAAAQLAAARRDQCQGIALLLAVSSWAEQPSPGASGNGSQADGPAILRPQPVAPQETQAAAAVLRAAGWRVVTIDASTPLALAWQRLPRFADQAGGLAAAYGADPSLRTV